MKIIILIVLGFIIYGCSADIASSADENTSKRKTFEEEVYSNSFELASDTAGWTGLVPEMFVKEAAPGCGKKSLYIGGGCMQPAASIKIKVNEAGNYNVSLWEKTPDSGGRLNIVVGDKDARARYVPLTSKNWKYHIIENLYIPGNSILTIELNVGGFIYASANIDELKIQKQID